MAASATGAGGGSRSTGSPRTRLGVLGWPVAHSRSPAIHNAALAAVGLSSWRYQLLPATPELLDELVAALPAAGFCGVNVTIPHKPAALALATAPTPRARAIGAANLLTFDPGAGVTADNTDAPALISALPFAVAGLSTLVLGAGGTARAAVWALVDAGAREVRVWNRTPARAERLAEELGAVAVTDAETADLVVNCTAVGLDGAGTLGGLPIEADRLRAFGCVADFVYAGAASELIRRARQQGVPTVDGIELLIGQGALSFERFTGRPAPLPAMRRAVGLAPE